MILSFLKKYKYQLLFNLIITILFLIISSTPAPFGIDDTYANTYIFHPEFTFQEKINVIIDRITNWNFRIGEFIYFVVGSLPRWIYFVILGITFSIFLNLVYVYCFGIKFKDIFNSKLYYLLHTISFLITITIYSAFSDTMVWMGGFFNHTFDANIVLITGLPYRFLLDKINIFENRKKLLIPFFAFSIMSGFSTENQVPWLLAYAGLITLYMYKNKSLKKWMIAGLITTFISFALLLLSSSTLTRINFFNSSEIQNSWASYSKQNMFYNILVNYKYIFAIVSILLFIYAKEKSNSKSNIIINLLQLAVSSVSIIVMVFSPYYTNRCTIIFYFFILVLINNIIYSFSFIKKYYLPILSISIVTALIFVVIDYSIYKDYDTFNKNRIDYILSQDSDEIDVPNYTGFANYPFRLHLLNYDYQFFDKQYLELLLKRNITQVHKVNVVE